MSFTTPASRLNRTWLARPPSSCPSTSAARTADAHCGYAGKSAITAMTAARGAAITMRELVLAVMLGAYRHPRVPPPYYHAST